MKKIILAVLCFLLFSVGMSGAYAQWFDTQEFYPAISQDLDYDYDQNLQSSVNFLHRQDSFNFNVTTTTDSMWYNHSPLFTSRADVPIFAKAGQTTYSTLSVIDPDTEAVYFSSNLGATGRTSGGDIAWSFSPTFPGLYVMNTVAYDARGGFAVMSTPVFVRPWWSL